MNGRIYSPSLGRMLSPDPVTFAPEDAQGYNRYSYVLNNPLRYTDPSGFSPNNKARIQKVDPVNLPGPMSHVSVTASRVSPNASFFSGSTPSSLVFGGSGSSSPSSAPGDIRDHVGNPVGENKDEKTNLKPGECNVTECRASLLGLKESARPTLWHQLIGSARDNLSLQFQAQVAFGIGGKILGEVDGSGGKSAAVATTKGYGYDLSARFSGPTFKSQGRAIGAYTSFSVSAGAPISFSFSITVDGNKNWEFSSAVGTGASLFIGSELGKYTQ